MSAFWYIRCYTTLLGSAYIIGFMVINGNQFLACFDYTIIFYLKISYSIKISINHSITIIVNN